MDSRPESRVFLTAEWRHLALLNYEVSPDLLVPFLPQGTELDDWKGKFFISLVGFRFINTKVLGFAFPFHRHFDEVNLRFYVRRRESGDWRRGVVFIREIVPRRLIAWIARALYNERYMALPMSHQIRQTGQGLEVEYQWSLHGRSNQLSVAVTGAPSTLPEGSEARFITEHFWGYSLQRDGAVIQYRVDHPSWKVWNADRAQFEGETAELYGPEFARILQRQPTSAFLADGSPVTVYRGRRI